MKLVRFGAKGSEKPGLVDSDGKIRDLSGHIADLAGEALAPESLAKLAKLDPTSLPLAPDGVRLGAPVAGTRTFIAIGLNYADHAQETGQEIPAEPILFNKAASCISGPCDDVMYPKNADRMDWEVRDRLRRRHARALRRGGGRSRPHRRLYDLQRCLRAALPGEAQRPVGQGQVGRDVRAAGALARHDRRDRRPREPRDVALVNGEVRQQGSTKTMIVSIPKLLAYVTEFMVLEAGDIVTTGTPPGVGSAMKPPQYLVAGDVMELAIEGLGRQRQTVVPFRA